MKKILFAFASLALATGAGCGGGGADEIVGKMRSFKDKICKCTTAECVDGVQKEIMDYALKNMDKIQKAEKSASESQKKAMQQIEDEMDKCEEKAKGGGEAATP